MKTPLKKDPVGMYSDIPIDQYSDLKRYSLEELKKLHEKMVNRDVAADKNPTVDEEYETHGADWEALKIRIEEEIRIRQNEAMGRSKK